MTFIHDVAEEDFVASVIDRSQTVPVVVDFWAEWCGPCKTLGPMLERVTNEHEGAFELAKVDVDSNQRLAGQMGVQGIPTVVAFVDGQPVSSFSGAIPEAQLREWLAQFVSEPTDPEIEAALDLIDAGDLAGAETLLRAILTERPDPDAAKTLATLLIDQDRMDEATEVLATLPADDAEAQRLRAIAGLADSAGRFGELEAAFTEDPSDAERRVSYAKALGGLGRYEDAFELLLEAVEGRDDDAEPSRAALVELFDLLGAENPLVGHYRRRLANALF